MRTFITFLTFCLCYSTASEILETTPNLRHRDLAKGGEMCLDLGSRRGGMHNMQVSADINKFLKYDGVKEGRCPDQSTKRMKKSYKKSLDSMEKYCKLYNKEKVTIVGPELLTKWMKEEVEASYGPCKDEDEIIIIEEII